MSCKTMSIDLANVPPVPIQIGVAGENSFRTITFDASKWGADYPDATYTVVYRRSDGYLYPVLVNASADAIVWSPTETDTAVSGNGQLEVRLLDGETIGKTIIMQTYVAPSLSGDESEPSTPAPDWVNDVAADADRAEAAVSHYPKIVDGVWFVWDAAQSEFVSTGINAQGEDGVSPTVTVTAIEGGHRVTITDADGAHTFDVMDGEGSQGGAVESVNGKTGAVVLDASDVGALPANTPIPAAVTEQTVAGWGFTKNTGTYSKPSGGIPASDLASGVIPDISGKVDKLAGHGLVSKRDVVNGYELSISENGSAANAQVVSIATYSAAMQQANQALAAKANTADVYTKTEIDNKGYQTSAQVQSAIAAAAELPTVSASDNGKVLGVVNGAWAAKSDEGGSTITVDDALSTSSENPVQNKVVKAALDAKVDAESVESLKTGYFELPYVLSPGYLSGSGAVMNPSATQEVYTSLISVKGGEILDINLQIGSVESSWFALCVYNSEKTFLRRTILQNSVNADSFNINLLIPNDAVYIAFTYRSYGTAVLTVKRTWTVIDEIVKQTRNIFGSKWTRLVYNASGVLVEPGNFRNVGTLPEIPVIGGKKYTVSFGEMQYTERIFAYVEQYGADGNFIGSITTGPSFPATFTANSNAVKIGLMIYAAGTAPTDFRQIIPEWTQLEIGETATQYVNHFAIVDDLLDGDASAKVWEQIESNVKNEISVVGSPNLTVKTIAHRGDDVLAPQCTAPSYVAARKRGIMIAENDLALSEDGQLVMWHDTSLSRLGDLVDINGYLMYTDGTNYYWVNNNSVYTWDGSSYAASSVALSGLTRCAGADYGVNSQYGAIGLSLEILKRIDFGAYKGEQFNGTQILTFAEWVLLCKQLGMECYVDKKLTYTDALIEEAASTVLQYGMGEHVSWLGLDTAKITKLREYISDARCGLLTHPTDALIQQMAPYNVGRGFFFNGDCGTMVETDIRKGLLAGFDVEVWFVGYGSLAESQILSTIRQAVSYGVTGITLDHYRVDDAFEIALNPIPAERPDGVLLSNVSQLINDSNYQTATQVQTAIAAIPDELPSVTASDNGKFLRVVSGAWAAQTVPSAEGASF